MRFPQHSSLQRKPGGREVFFSYSCLSRQFLLLFPLLLRQDTRFPLLACLLAAAVHSAAAGARLCRCTRRGARRWRRARGDLSSRGGRERRAH
jgi:hypothetical protein